MQVGGGEDSNLGSLTLEHRCLETFWTQPVSKGLLNTWSHVHDEDRIGVGVSIFPAEA